MQRLLLLFALTGCPSHSRYVVADVTAARVPVQGALVAAECGEHHNAALRTDEDGRARIRMYHDSDRCSLVVAKPGLPTVETGAVNVCPTATACAPARIELVAPSHVMHDSRAIDREAHDSRDTESRAARPAYARPAMEVAQ